MNSPDLSALDAEVLCGSRVSQMTKTYNDIDAVTRLLEEKENDLELAARIGQQLVCRNKALEERQVALETELASATDANTQLQHQLTLKTNLLSIYTDDVDDSSCDATPSGARHISVDLLQEKVRSLQDDNKALRDEAHRLAGETSEVEERENSLMHDIIKQLDSANNQNITLTSDLKTKNDETLKLHEETTQLLAQIVDLQAKLKESSSECQELHSMLQISRECQHELTGEIVDLKDKYAEVLDLLHDAQEQLRQYSKKNLGLGASHRPHSTPGRMLGSSFLSAGDSIACELSSLEGPSPQTLSSSSGNVSKVFDTVRLSSKATPTTVSHTPYIPGYSSYTPGYASYTPGYSNSTPGYTSHTPGIGNYNTRGYSSNRFDSLGVTVSTSGHVSLDSGADSDMHTDTEDNYPASTVGVPGYPGMPDLDRRIQRIRPAYSNSLALSPSMSTNSAVSPASRAATSTSFSSPDTASQPLMPYGCRTPDSIMATGGGSSTHKREGEWQGGRFPPNKLQIIKPMEGSHTLHQWSRLATPHLGGVLQPHREGIAHRGGVGSRGDLELYSLSSEYEEDDEAPSTSMAVPTASCPSSAEPRKQFMDTSAVFTYTNSTILHVDDCTLLTQMGKGVQLSACIPPSLPPLPAGPPPAPSGQPSVPPSRRNSTATFSTNVGIARVLQERGVAKSAAGGRGDEPTATPANSPDGSGSNTPVGSYYNLLSLQDFRSTILYGATYIRRTFLPSPATSPVSSSAPHGDVLTALPPSASAHANLSSHHSVGGVIAPRPLPPSPLLHLSNLIRSTSSPAAALSQPPSDLPSPEAPTAIDLPSPGARRPPLPSNIPLGMPLEPGRGHLERSQRGGSFRTDLGRVPKMASSASVGPGAMGQLGVMSVGRKGGLL